MKHVIPVHGIKTTAQKLQKLSEDCNMTARLEAKLQLAVGAQVMLCLNIDTNAGLVNGAIHCKNHLVKTTMSEGYCSFRVH